MKSGDTFLRPARATETENPHLWIVLTDPDRDNRVLIVSLTTLREGQDQTVILNVGDHPFINRPSSVFYRQVEIVDSIKLEQAEKAGSIARRENCSPEVLRLIRDGVSASPHTVRLINNFYKNSK